MTDPTFSAHAARLRRIVANGAGHVMSQADCAAAWEALVYVAKLEGTVRGWSMDVAKERALGEESEEIAAACRIGEAREEA